MSPDDEHEHEHQHQIVVGVDEAGRGCLAGPVVAAAVVWDPRLRTEADDPRLPLIQDSKRLTAAQRTRAAAVVRELATAWAVCEVQADEIDRVNILHATIQAMHGALDSVAMKDCIFDIVLVDGDRFKPYMPPPGSRLAAREDGGFIPHTCVVDGDTHILSIAAASILAKTHRDALMRGAAHVAHPQYGFDRHVGYGTPVHLAALREYGACPLHRRSFAPVKRSG